MKKFISIFSFFMMLLTAISCDKDDSISQDQNPASDPQSLRTYLDKCTI